MGNRLNIGEIMKTQKAETVEVRDIETITVEILSLKKTAGESILGIGQRLIEAKSMLPHGEWAAWLAERVEFSPRTAQNFMRLSREWTNTQALADLGATKALTLLALPPEERDLFMAETHVVDGEEKTVIDMSARQLEQVIKERDEARLAMESAASDAKAAEEARAKMEADMGMLKGLLESANADKAKKEKTVAELEKQLAEAKAAPVEVAVMSVDQEALDKARADAIAEMQEKLDKAKEEKVKAVEKRKAAEESIALLKEQLEAAQRAEKRAAIASDKDMATFEVLFNQAKEIANMMQGLLIKARGRDNQEVAGKLQAAMKALSVAIGRAAE